MTRKRAVLGLSAALAALFIASGAQAAEQLLYGRPDRWHVAYQKAGRDMDMTEMIPDGESLDAWTQMLTVQTFYRRSGPDPSVFLENLRSRAGKDCPAAFFTGVRAYEDRGYPAADVTMYCPNAGDCGGAIPHHVRRNRGEITFFKVIRGRDHLYVVQRAWSGRPFRSEQDAGIPPGLKQEWAEFFDRVRVSSRFQDGVESGKK